MVPHTFNLVFQLPYCAWRSYPCPSDDNPRKANGEPLRISRSLEFLSPENKMPNYMHEVCFSCVLTGLDDFRWEAYVFNDTLFDKDLTRQSVTYYNESSEDFRMDPLISGQYDADKPLWNPREYFLAVFEARSQQVVDEWRNVVHQLRSLLEQYVSTPVPYGRCFPCLS